MYFLYSASSRGLKETTMMAYFMGEEDYQELTAFSNLLDENNLDDVFENFNNAEAEPALEAEPAPEVGSTSAGVLENYVAGPKSTSAYPSTEEFEGEFQFELEMNGQLAGKDWLYSDQLNKVFVNIMKPIFVEVKHKPVKQGLYIRAVLVFLGTEHFSEPVVRCLQHLPAGLPMNKGYEDIVEHVIRSDHPGAAYYYDRSSKRYSVVVPLEEPQPGSSSVLISYTFTCKNSCPGGMNRRATKIIFTLEDQNGSVYGRKCMEVRICSCPKRDKTKEESDTRGSTHKRPMTEVPAMPTKKQALADETRQLEVPVKLYNLMAGTLYTALYVQIQNEKRQPTPTERRLLQKYKFPPTEFE